MIAHNARAMPGAILIIEDDHALRDELIELATALGAQVTGAATGDDARRACAAMRFALILCDYKLQSETGLEVLRMLELGEADQGRPAIYLMTGHLDLTTAARRQIEDSTDGLLMKPVRSAELRRLIRESGAVPPC